MGMVTFFFPSVRTQEPRHRHVGTEVDSFTQATTHTENLGCLGQILAALVKSWLLWSQMQSSRRSLCRHELSSVHVLWFALFCADLLKDWMYVLSIQIHALGRETGRIVP